MKFLIALFMFILFNGISARIPNSSEILRTVEIGDSAKLYKIFQNIEDLTLDEAKLFVEDLFAIIKYKYEGQYQDMNILSVKQLLLNFVEYYAHDSEKAEKVEEILDGLTNNLIEKELEKKLKDENQDEVSIPGGVIVGSIEVICGGLLLLTPWKAVGSGLIVDGMRRILDETEEIDKENQRREEEQRKKEEEVNQSQFNNQPAY